MGAYSAMSILPLNRVGAFGDDGDGLLWLTGHRELPADSGARAAGGRAETQHVLAADHRRDGRFDYRGRVSRLVGHGLAGLQQEHAGPGNVYRADLA